MGHIVCMPYATMRIRSLPLRLNLLPRMTFSNKMVKLNQVEQANILEKFLASQNSKERLETWALQLLEALKEVADLTEKEGMTLEDLRAITLEIRYNLREGPVKPGEIED